VFLSNVDLAVGYYLNPDVDISHMLWEWLEPEQGGGWADLPATAVRPVMCLSSTRRSGAASENPPEWESSLLI